MSYPVLTTRDPDGRVFLDRDDVVAYLREAAASLERAPEAQRALVWCADQLDTR